MSSDCRETGSIWCPIPRFPDTIICPDYLIVWVNFEHRRSAQKISGLPPLSNRYLGIFNLKSWGLHRLVEDCKWKNTAWTVVQISCGAAFLGCKHVHNLFSLSQFSLCKPKLLWVLCQADHSVWEQIWVVLILNWCKENLSKRKWHSYTKILKTSCKKRGEAALRGSRVDTITVFSRP